MKNPMLRKEVEIRENGAPDIALPGGHIIPDIEFTHTDNDKEISKDTLDIQTLSENGPLKSCILISKGDGTDERISVKKAKSVQFADTLGKPLKSVKTLVDSPDDLFGLNFLSLRSTTRRSFQTSDNIFQRKGDTNKNNENNGGGHCVNFKTALEFNELEARVESDKVCLEKITFVKENGVSGTVVVKNLCFEKYVIIRYTWDNWKSYETEAGKYLSLSVVRNADVFSFEIVPRPLEGNACNSNLMFAICYTAKGNSYWDSNFGKNYSIVFKTEKREEQPFSLNEDKTGYIFPIQNFGCAK